MAEKKITTYKFDDFILEADQHRLLIGEKEIYLRPKTLHLLIYLIERNDHLVEKDELLRNVWVETIVTESSLSQCIKEIRKALRDDANNPHYLKTIHKVGFKFSANVEKVMHQVGDQSITSRTNLITESEHEKSSQEDDNLKKQSKVRKLNSKRILLFTIICVLFIIVIAIWLSNFNEKPSIAFEERSWLLITDFENYTEDENIDLALRSILEWEMSRSAYVNIVPAGRISDALKLMQIEPTVNISSEIGREICIRDGGIDAMLTGEIQVITGVYEISVKIEDPVEGNILTNLLYHIENEEEMVLTIRNLASELRGSLGESLASISKTEQQLEKVTTPSLKALKYHSQGWHYKNEFEWEKAKLMFDEAIQEDSSLAMSYVGLGFSHLWLGNLNESKASFETASSMVENVTIREKYFILGSYYGYALTDYQKSISNYEILIDLYPDDYWGHENLSMSYQWMGNYRKVKLHKEEATRIRPHYAINHSDLGILALFIQGDIDKAHSELSYALQLNPDLPHDLVQLCNFFLYWMHDDYNSADNELNEFLPNKINLLLPDFKLSARWKIARYYIYKGKYQDALDILNEAIKIGSKNVASNFLVWTELELGLNYFVLGYEDKSEELLNEISAHSLGMARIETLGWLAIKAARDGKIEKAVELLKEQQDENRFMSFDIIHPPLRVEMGKVKRAFKEYVYGEIAFLEGNFELAIQQFELVKEIVPNHQLPALTVLKPQLHILSLYSLAKIYENQMELDKALEMYDIIYENKILTITQSIISIVWRNALSSIISILINKGEIAQAYKIKEQYSYLNIYPEEIHLQE
jgi:DNA-binding winged helix-turn-helix (wHTH) protein/tetratricopeptide (TPR) repeat protein